MGFRLAPEAETELDDIWLYVARASGSMEIADRVADSITDCYLMLGRNPRVGRRRDQDLQPGLRSFPIGEHVVIYRIEDEDAFILHVIPAMRDLEKLLD